MKKKLYKSKNDRKICGVCGGIAEYFKIDSTIVRLITIIIVLWFGIGIIAYIIAAFIMPENNSDVEFIPKNSKESKKLYKSVTDKKICGVCGGIANYLNADSTLIRVLWILLVFVGGSGILAYIVAAIIMPIEVKDIKK